MNVTIERKKLIDVLSLGGSLAGKAKTMEILNYAKVVIKSNNTMLVSSSDNQGFITNRTSVLSTDGEGQFCVEPTLMLKALKTLKEEQVTLNISDAKIVCKREKGVMEFPVTSAEEYITFTSSSDVQTYEIDSEKLFEWCNTAKFFTSAENIRPILGGMLLYAKGNEIGCCATDSQKLYADFYTTENEINGELRAVIPNVVLPLLCQVINGTDTAKISVDAKNITIKGNDAKLSVKLIEGNYPNFKAVIPLNNNINVTTSTSEFIDCITRISLFASATPALKIEVSGMDMKLTCEDIMMSRKATDDMWVEHSGGDITIGANSEFLLQILRNVLSEKATLNLNDATRPILVKDEDRPNKTLLCMPIML